MRNTANHKVPNDVAQVTDLTQFKVTNHYTKKILSKKSKMFISVCRQSKSVAKKVYHTKYDRPQKIVCNPTNINTKKLFTDIQI